MASVWLHYSISVTVYQSCTDIAFCRLYRYHVQPIIETADTDYAADYDTDYKRLIKTDILSENFFIPRKIYYFTLRIKISDDLFLVINHK